MHVKLYGAVLTGMVELQVVVMVPVAVVNRLNCTLPPIAGAPAGCVSAAWNVSVVPGFSEVLLHPVGRVHLMEGEAE